MIYLRFTSRGSLARSLISSGNPVALASPSRTNPARRAMVPSPVSRSSSRLPERLSRAVRPGPSGGRPDRPAGDRIDPAIGDAHRLNPRPIRRYRPLPGLARRVHLVPPSPAGRPAPPSPTSAPSQPPRPRPGGAAPACAARCYSLRRAPAGPGRTASASPCWKASGARSCATTTAAMQAASVRRLTTSTSFDPSCSFERTPRPGQPSGVVRQR